MTIEELKLELEEMKNHALETLQEMYEQKYSQNTYAVGYECGVAGACFQMLKLINGVEE